MSVNSFFSHCLAGLVPELSPGNKQENVLSAVNQLYSSLIDYLQLHHLPFDENLPRNFINQLPNIRNMILEDLNASSRKQDVSPLELLMYCSGSMAMIHYRIANSLWTLKCPVLPSELMARARQVSHADIHPGAIIGRRCVVLCSGVGVVITSGCTLGNDVTLDHGVTLMKSVLRGGHGPRVGDQVDIEALATVVGPVEIGMGTRIGGNVWVSSDVHPNMFVVQPLMELQNSPSKL
eukprot:PhF_6_TR19750/c0_g1_i1/m.28814/K00640/cysE; serine O-acetyltransferase